MPMILLVLVPLIVLAVYFVSVYNFLSKSGVRINEAWSQVDVQLKRRIDLIPNLVETVKGYAQHEKEVFENVTKARAALMQAKGAKETAQADNMLDKSLKSLFAVAEAYPELRAQEGFVYLQKELSDTESKVAYARHFYNTIIREYNSKVIVFPSNLVAKLFGFSAKEFFRIEETEREAVKIKF